MTIELTNNEKRMLLNAVARGILDLNTIPRITDIMKRPERHMSDQELDREIEELKRKLDL